MMTMRSCELDDEDAVDSSLKQMKKVDVAVVSNDRRGCRAKVCAVSTRRLSSLMQCRQWLMVRLPDCWGAVVHRGSECAAGMARNACFSQGGIA